MNKINLKERFYRDIIESSGLKNYPVKIQETDLLVLSEKNLSKEIKEEVVKQRDIIKDYIRKNPEFLTSFSPLACKNKNEIIRIMCLSGEMTETGPMASVAGAIAEIIGKNVFKEKGDFFIENGGDIYARVKNDFTAGIYAGSSPFSMKIGIRLNGRAMPYGIATSSGTVGHSFSYGNADAVTVISKSAAFSDGAATHFGNLVKGKIEQQFFEKELQKFPFIEAILIIKGTEMFLWGDMELVYF
ncbi:MAG TPA: UPF0280 family protein [bacterium]|nr:UPF0280 family protein [bacterium]